MSRIRVMTRRPMKDVLWEAQSGKCWLCDGQMRFHGKMSPERATLDHVWPKAYFGNIGDVGVTLLAHRSCNQARGAALPEDDDVRKLVGVWRRVDRYWLHCNLEMVEASLRTLEAQRLRASILRLFAEAA